MRHVGLLNDRWRFESYTEGMFPNSRASDLFDVDSLAKKGLDPNCSKGDVEAISNGFVNAPVNCIDNSWSKVHAGPWVRQENMS